ncbi:hypothetical protein CVIRNUC_007909 [Coccomyxa viridis]|uniref:J domain-containing protein n=1 Tax=Coccomyxa viridis TaxID=1274662 RepID=A0AAV1IE51_9CHLO|nr:hypothetical protein CVIRNUC_007909 [Coccomyxa viridis]
MDTEGTDSNGGSFYAILNVPGDASEDDIKKSFRQLAQAYHPDKHTDPALKAHAAAQFTKLQEAYEVLGNAARRQVYDIYGTEGLAAGLQVVPSGKNTEALKQEWEGFRAQQRLQSEIAHRGFYSFKVSAADFLDPYDARVRSKPELYEVAMNSQLSSQLSDSTIVTVGGQMAVQGNVGGGSFVCGLKRVLSEYHSLDFQGAVGLKTFASLQSTRQLSEHTSAGLGLTWQPRVGAGLQLSSTRQLSDTTSADFTWMVGPRAAQGAGLSISRRGERLTTSAGLNVGAATALSARAVWRFSDKSSVRAVVRVGTSGIEVELGGAQRVSEFSTAGLGVSVGLTGVFLKPRFTRGTHTFDFPILLTHDYTNWRMVLGAYLVPPVTILVVKRGIIRPLLRWHRLKQRTAKELEHLQLAQQVQQAAADSAKLMAPVARRKVRKEIEKGGLVVVSARYGVLEDILKQEKSGSSAEEPNTGHASTQAPGQGGQRWRRHRGVDGDEEDSAEDPIEQQAVDAAVAARSGSQEQPPPWLEVTTALQFMTDDGRLVFHAVPKSGLMGFGDSAHGEAKHLRVHFLWHGRPHVASLADQEAGTLPDKGTLATSESEASAILSAAAALEARLHPVSMRVQDNPAFAPEG